MKATVWRGENVHPKALYLMRSNIPPETTDTLSESLKENLKIEGIKIIYTNSLQTGQRHEYTMPTVDWNAPCQAMNTFAPVGKKVLSENLREKSKVSILWFSVQIDSNSRENGSSYRSNLCQSVPNWMQKNWSSVKSWIYHKISIKISISKHSKKNKKSKQQDITMLWDLFNNLLDLTRIFMKIKKLRALPQTSSENRKITLQWLRKNVKEVNQL